MKLANYGQVISKSNKQNAQTWKPCLRFFTDDNQHKSREEELENSMYNNKCNWLRTDNCLQTVSSLSMKFIVRFLIS